MIKVAIIGAGLIGRKRAQNLPDTAQLSVVCNRSLEKGKQMADEFKARFEPDWTKVVTNPEIDAVIVATTHEWLVPISIESIKNGKHVFIEKPGARNLEEFNTVIEAHKKNPVTISVGYNHRYHKPMIQAKQIIESGEYGPVLFARFKYGHGGRPGYESEWRFKKELSGGGLLMDLGPHLIDLTNYFVGPLNDVSGYIGNVFWKTDLEDVAFFTLKNKKNQFSHISVTCVEWKNLFSIEIMLRTAKIQIDGIGRSYGKEKLTLYTMKPEMGPPDEQIFHFPEEDTSWKYENEFFFDKIVKKDVTDKSLLDTQYVFKVISDLYKINNK
jgi:predicted dehydrogenase